ncbi:MAG: hypothetical protein SFW09_11235 [Hyphomicrobiaceae bacterium]|nr:hypothetical protein [Hyphomicrobiaceae bacterium]
MALISKVNRQAALSDPEAEFERAADVVECAGLTRGEKLSALRQWQSAVQRRLESADEGMVEHIPGTLTRDAELLSEIGRCIAEVEEAFVVGR